MLEKQTSFPESIFFVNGQFRKIFLLVCRFVLVRCEILVYPYTVACKSFKINTMEIRVSDQFSVECNLQLFFRFGK